MSAKIVEVRLLRIDGETRMRFSMEDTSIVVEVVVPSKLIEDTDGFLLRTVLTTTAMEMMSTVLESLGGLECPN